MAWLPDEQNDDTSDPAPKRRSKLHANQPHLLHRLHHPELVDLCEEMVAIQKMEIVLMQMWLCDWYGIGDWKPNLRARRSRSAILNFRNRQIVIRANS